MKRIPFEERRIAISISLSPATLVRIDELAAKLKSSRSSIVAEAIREYFDSMAAFEDVSDFPDDVSEVGYIYPYTGSYEEDL